MPDNESELSSSDQEEIQKYLLTDEEKMLKSVVWHEMNKEWIGEQQEKERNKKRFALLQSQILYVYSSLKLNFEYRMNKVQKPKEPKVVAKTMDEAIRNSKKLKSVYYGTKQMISFVIYKLNIQMRI